MATITAQDGTGDSTTPVQLERWETGAESGNTVTPMLDGTLAVTVIGDLPRAGTLQLLYASDEAAEAARVLLARRTTFALTAPERPVFDMHFARFGTITPAIHDELDDVWQISVGFQEIEVP
ncbi:hypothetical protein [Microbacterium sp.]|uniref:hypothetical protein n=1 Tax=Actinomycetes TaxID=1760 RepID=UPI0037C5B94D